MRGCSNLPKWTGASRLYSWAYAYMAENGADPELIDALNKGDEESIKYAHLEAITRRF